MAGTPTEASVHGAGLTTEYGAATENDCGAVETVEIDGLGCAVCGSGVMVLADMFVRTDRATGVERWECAVCRSPVDRQVEEVDQ